ncbi:hypothetical protein [Pelagicoccus sp. SDUM812002]|uniref:hypothetical protein n=1 Tax=Pelagicoccus sp. SDUM812002 TaxID=3041266 RepID=UPI00280EE989|nr:hypothetical protein [Pelagicoccus sp. SDUM812002]MDQ8187126.1 hypothetical protein [Pelagicoccus sp. SDUM812002]
MNPHTLKKLSAAAALLGSTSIAFAGGSFQEASDYLDLDGDFIGFMDFDGDGQAIGEKLNVIYQDMAQVVPDMPPIPLDFPALFETMGFGSIRSMGVSSSEIEEGLYRNRSVTLLEGDPEGLFKLYGLESIPFRAAQIAPADATSAFSGKIDFNQLVSTARALAAQVMGPMGEGMVDQGLMQPIPGTDVTAQEAVAALSGGMDVVMSQSLENPDKPEFKVWASLKGAGSLLPRLEPLFSQMGIQFVDTAAGRFADLSMLMEGAPIGLFIESPAGSEDLILYTDKEWVSTFGVASGRLVDTEGFKNVAGRLPQDAAFYAYSSGFDTQQLEAILSRNPDTAVMAPAIVKAIDSLFGGFVAPSASATFRDGDALVTEGYGGFSYKSIIVALPAGIGAGIGAGIVAEQAKNASSWSGEDTEEYQDDGSLEE